jgi:hypothetical protein
MNFFYEQICSQLADFRLAIYRDEGLRIPSDCYECLYMVQSVILLQYISGSGNVEKNIMTLKEYYKELTTEQKQKSSILDINHQRAEHTLECAVARGD